MPGWLESSNFWWRVVHVFCFALGGTTFIVGTACYFDSIAAYSLGAWLYIIGSCGFLGVDVLEMATFYSIDKYLTINIALSIIGSTLYILGSVGFLPSLSGADGSTSSLGVWGFILGSFFIGSSQVWKVFRIGTTGPERHHLLVNQDDNDDEDSDRALGTADFESDDDEEAERANNYTYPPGTGIDEVDDEESFLQVVKQSWEAFQFSNLWHNADNATSVGVEANAGLGGWCFFFGTIMYNARALPEGTYLQAVLTIWVFGSIFFTLGSCFLGYRHFRMNL